MSIPCANIFSYLTELKSSESLRDFSRENSFGNSVEGVQMVKPIASYVDDNGCRSLSKESSGIHGNYSKELRVSTELIRTRSEMSQVSFIGDLGKSQDIFNPFSCITFFNLQKEDSLKVDLNIERARSSGNFSQVFNTNDKQLMAKNEILNEVEMELDTSESLVCRIPPSPQISSTDNSTQSDSVGVGTQNNTKKIKTKSQQSEENNNQTSNINPQSEEKLNVSKNLNKKRNRSNSISSVKHFLEDHISQNQAKKKSKMKRACALLDDSLIQEDAKCSIIQETETFNLKMKEENEAFKTFNKNLQIYKDECYENDLKIIEDCHSHKFMKEHFPNMYAPLNFFKNIKLLKDRRVEIKEQIIVTHHSLTNNIKSNSFFLINNKIDKEYSLKKTWSNNLSTDSNGNFI